MSFGRKLKSVCESQGVAAVSATFADALREKKVNVETLSIRDIAESLCGESWQDNIQKYANRSTRAVMESTAAVDASAFANITGQLLVNEIGQKYQDAAFIGLKLISTDPITNGNLGPQRVPWLGKVAHGGEVVQPGMPYPSTDFGEQFVDMPKPEKFGQICRVTMEAIYSDLTGQIRESAGDVGRAVGLEQEKRILKVILGIVENHSWNGTARSTYYVAGDSGPWTNEIGTQVLADYTDINVIENLLNEMVDPVTGERIDIVPNGLLVMPAKLYTARNIIHGTQVREGGDVTAAHVATYAPNPVANNYPLYTSKHAHKLLVDQSITSANATDHHFLGDFKRAFTWRQAKPFYTEEAPAGFPDAFNNDIILAVKAGWFGVAAVRDPRYVVHAFGS